MKLLDFALKLLDFALRREKSDATIGIVVWQSFAKPNSLINYWDQVFPNYGYREHMIEWRLQTRHTGHWNKQKWPSGGDKERVDD